MRLLIIDDHPLFREGVAQMLRAVWPQAEVLCAGNAEAGLALARNGADLILLDMSLPGMAGAEALAAIRRQHPEIPVAVLTASEDRRDREASMRAGARAYINKATSPEALLDTVTRVIAGETVLPSTSRAASLAAAPAGLTPRQREILDLICRGHPNKEIALRLNLAETTVKTHVTAIFQALQVVNRTQAVVAARRYGWVAPDSAVD